MKVPSEYPALGYNFSVAAVDSLSSASASVISSDSKDAEFQSISGIKAERITEPYEALGYNNMSYQLPYKTKYEDLILERGIVRAPSEFINWCNAFINLDASDAKGSNSLSTNSLSSKIILVFLWDRDRNKPLMTWTFYNAFPKGIEYSGIIANENSYAIETITIAYSHFTTKHDPPKD